MTSTRRRTLRLRSTHSGIAFLALTALGSSLTLGGAGCAATPSDTGEATGNARSADIAAVNADKSITFEVYVPRVIADHITDESGLFNTRDETYLQVYGMTPQGPADARLPRNDNGDDYYEFWNATERNDVTEGWINEDQVDLRHPRIWNGTLFPGQAAAFQIVVMEQDRKDGHALGTLISDACSLLTLGGDVAGAGKTAEQTLKDAQAVCTSLAGAIPSQTKDETIGIFEISVKNVDGTLAVNTAPIKIDGAVTSRGLADGSDADAINSYQAAQAKDGKFIDAFRMNGGSSSYYAEIAVRATDGITNPLIYTGNGADDCRYSTNVRAVAIDGTHSITVGSVIDLRAGYAAGNGAGTGFHWSCGSDYQETQECPAGTNYVRASRVSGDIRVFWTCFEERSLWTKTLGDGLYGNGGAIWRAHGDELCDVPANSVSSYLADPRSVADLGPGHAYTGTCHDDPPTIGAFWKWYGDAPGPSADFSSYQALRYAGGAPNAVAGAQIVRGYFDGDTSADLLVFRPSDGAFWKWYGDSAVSPDFGYQAQRYLGGAPNVVSDAQIIAGDWDGNGRTDILVFHPSDGGFWKAYADASGRSADFSNYQPERFLGGAAGAFTGARIIPGDFNGDHKTDLFVYRGSDGAFFKMYGNDDPSAPSADFLYEPLRYVGGAPNVVPNAQIVPGDWNGDGYTDLVVFQGTSGAFWKWYGDASISADFNYQPLRYVGGVSGFGARMQLVPGDFNGDKSTDVVVFRPSDGAFWKWYGGTLVSPDFIYSAGRFIGGSPGIVTGARMVTGDFNGDTRSDVLVFRPSDGAFWKWYGAAPVSPDFTYEAGRFIGGSPGIVTGAQMIPVDFSGDHRDDVLVYR